MTEAPEADDPLHAIDEDRDVQIDQQAPDRAIYTGRGAIVPDALQYFPFPPISPLLPFLRSGVSDTSVACDALSSKTSLMRYLHYDVFTDTPFEGNQLAVFPAPPHDLPAETMQRIAAEMAFSETTFVFAPVAGGDVRMRIFTPGVELPMAGHPTIGSTFALAHAGVIAAGRDTFVFELGVGPIPVSLEWGAGGLTFAWMTQPLPSFGTEIKDRGGFAAAIGLETGDLEDLPIEEISCGVPFLFAP